MRAESRLIALVAIGSGDLRVNCEGAERSYFYAGFQVGPEYPRR